MYVLFISQPAGKGFRKVNGQENNSTIQHALDKPPHKNVNFINSEKKNLNLYCVSEAYKMFTVLKI